MGESTDIYDMYHVGILNTRPLKDPTKSILFVSTSHTGLLLQNEGILRNTPWQDILIKIIYVKIW